MIADSVSMTANVFTRGLDIAKLCVTGTNSKPYYVNLPQLGGDHVNLAGIIYTFQQRLVQAIFSLKAIKRKPEIIGYL